jgi:hypothetical protein
MFSTTFRWNDGSDAERYDAVEARETDLVWYAWSHRHGQGRTDEATQSYEALLRDGPLRAIPAHARAELEAIARAKLGLGSPS